MPHGTTGVCHCHGRSWPPSRPTASVPGTPASQNRKGLESLGHLGCGVALLEVDVLDPVSGSRPGAGRKRRCFGTSQTRIAAAVGTSASSKSETRPSTSMWTWTAVAPCARPRTPSRTMALMRASRPLPSRLSRAAMSRPSENLNAPSILHTLLVRRCPTTLTVKYLLTAFLVMIHKVGCEAARVKENRRSGQDRSQSGEAHRGVHGKPLDFPSCPWCDPASKSLWHLTATWDARNAETPCEAVDSPERHQPRRVSGASPRPAGGGG